MSIRFQPLTRGRGNAARATIVALGIAASLASGPTAKAQQPSHARTRTALSSPHASMTAPGAAAQGYDQLLARARAIVSSQPSVALDLAKQAIHKDPSRYEAHVVAAKSLRQQGQYLQAIIHLRIAMTLAPAQETAPIARATEELNALSLAPDARRKLDALKLLLGNADAASGGARQADLRQFLTMSGDFLSKHPLFSDLWLMRAQVAIELDDPKAGWQAGRQLIAFGEDANESPSVRKLMATLELKGWLGDSAPLSPEEQLEQNRQKITGVWKCTEQSKGDTIHYDFRYAAGLFHIAILGAKEVVYPTDGTPQFHQIDDMTESQQTSWSGLVLTSRFKMSSKDGTDFLTARWALDDSGLTYSSDATGANGHNYAFQYACLREDRTTAEAEVRSEVEQANAAVRRFLDYVRTNAIDVADLQFSAKECSLAWTELTSQAFGRNYGNLNRSVLLSDGNETKIVENHSGPGYSFQPDGTLGNIFLNTYAEAEQAETLYRDAARRCSVLRNYAGLEGQ